MALYQEPMERLTKILSTSATVTTEQLRKYGTFSITGSSATITLPTPSENNCGLLVCFVNNTSGSVSLACNNGFVQDVDTVTIETSNSQLVFSMKVSTTAYRWVTFGIAGTIADLQETVEDYIDGLLQSGTMIAWTYTDNAESAGTGEFSIVDDSVTLAKLANVGTAGDPLVSGGTGANPSYTTLGVSGGGSGAVTLLDHGVLVGSGTSAITPLAVGTNGQVLVGSTGADPVFASITAGDGIDVTEGAGTLAIAADVKANSGIVIDTTELSLDLGASAITGTLAVADGGTGVATAAIHGVLLGNAANAINVTAAGTDGQVLIAGTGVDPGFVTVTDGEGITTTLGSKSLTIAVDWGTEPGQVATSTSGQAGSATTISRSDHCHDLGVHTHLDNTVGGTITAAAISDATATPTASKIPIADGSGKLDGWISIATAATPGLIEHLNWGDFVPVLVWADATPTGLTVVGRYRHIGNGVEFVINIRGADGAGGTLSSATLPVTPSDLNIVIPVCGLQKVDTTWTNPEAYIDAETDLKIEFKGISACTDDAAFEIALSGSYEVAAT